MLEKTRLEELSIALPDKERKELLERISRRMEREESEEGGPRRAAGGRAGEDHRLRAAPGRLRGCSSWSGCAPS